MGLVEIERKQARKACNNARGVVRLGCILSPPHYMQTHWPLAWTHRCNNPRKRTYNAKLVSVFAYGVNFVLKLPTKQPQLPGVYIELTPCIP
jgi:hypothetical protein